MLTCPIITEYTITSMATSTALDTTTQTTDDNTSTTEEAATTVPQITAESSSRSPLTQPPITTSRQEQEIIHNRILPPDYEDVETGMCQAFLAGV